MTRDRAVALAVLIYAALVVLSLWTTGVPLTHEDGFYYFAIARNLASGAGSTFDGLHATSGYQPLWMLVLAVVHSVVPEGRGLVAGTLLQGLLMSGAAGLLYLAARERVGLWPAAISALTWVGLCAPIALGGLEFTLHGLLVIACAWAWLGGRGDGRGWSLGALLALAMLARLDVLLLLAAIGVCLLAAQRRSPRTGGAGVIRVVGPAAVTFLAYAAWNTAAFGRPLPVSAAAKRLWSHALLVGDPAYQAHGWIWAKVQNALWIARHLDSAWVLALVVGTIGAAVVSFTPAGRCTRALRPFVAGGVLQLAAYVLVHHGELSYARWYYVLQPLLAAFVAADLLEWTLTRLRARQWLGATACGLVILATANGLWQWRREEERRGSRLPLLEAAAWAAAQLPADARIGSWNAGTLGYLSGRTVVNLDGLVNSWEYLESGQYDLCRYWERTGITHLVDAFAEEGPGGSPAVVPVVLPAARDFARCAHRLERVWQDGPGGLPWRMRAYRLADRP